MKLKDSLISAKFVGRPNRFITIVNIAGKEHESHLPDPGRLRELLKEGCKLWVRHEINISDRSPITYNVTPGLQRGNSSDKDWYAVSGIILTYEFFKDVVCPKW